MRYLPNMISYDMFVDYYLRYGKCPNTSASRKRPLNERQLKTAYARYLRSENRKIVHREEKAKVRDQSVNPSGPRRCNLLMQLTAGEEEELRENAGGLISTVDRAHIFGKGAFPWMRYDQDNIVWLNRWSHRCLDNQQNPITGELTTPDDIRVWWTRIVGVARYQSLSERSKVPKQTRRKKIVMS